MYCCVGHELPTLSNAVPGVELFDSKSDSGAVLGSSAQPNDANNKVTPPIAAIKYEKIIPNVITKTENATTIGQYDGDGM